MPMPFTSSGGDDASSPQGTSDGQDDGSGQDASNAQDANPSPGDDTFVISDDGTLDAETSALLVQLHGC